MRVIAYPEAVPALPGRVIALGHYDGVHIGHRAVLTAGSALLTETPALTAPGVLTVLTLCGLCKGDRLCDEEQTRCLLRQAGVAEQLAVPFEAVRDMTPEAFVQTVLRDYCGAAAVVCGEDYRFGKDAAGDADTLTALCEQAGIRVQVVPTVTVDGEPVSSSRIRMCLAQGDVAAANRMLGYAYGWCAPVEKGRRLGRILGYPTLNQPIGSDCPLRRGVYASTALVEGRTVWGVTNVGVHPSVGVGKPLAETWLSGVSGSLYGQEIPVTPVRFLRAEQTFDSLKDLKEQIARDAETARQLFEGNDTAIKAVLFDFDETLQDRRAAYMAYARDFLTALCPEMTERERETEAQYMTDLNNGGYRTGGINWDHREYFAMVAAHLGRELPDLPAVIEDYRRRFPQKTRLLPGAVSLLNALRERGLLVGIVTNGSGIVQSRKLDHSGLRPLLDAVLISETEGVQKPDPELFCRAAARLGVSPAQCVYVGDHPQNDIEGAGNAGMHPVQVAAYGQKPLDGVPCITELWELTALLKADGFAT